MTNFYDYSFFLVIFSYLLLARTRFECGVSIDEGDKYISRYSFFFLHVCSCPRWL